MTHDQNRSHLMDASRYASQIRSLALAASALSQGNHPTDKVAVATAVDDLLAVIGMLAQQSSDTLDELEAAAH